MSSFYITHAICLNIGIWLVRFVLSFCVFNCTTFMCKMVFQFFLILFQKGCFRVKVIETFKISKNFCIKMCQSFKQRSIFKNSSTALQNRLRSLDIFRKFICDEAQCCFKTKTNSHLVPYPEFIWAYSWGLFNIVTTEMSVWVSKRKKFLNLEGSGKGSS